MAITQNAIQINPNSAAKDGTLAAQGALAANQILFDSLISVSNNGNLVTSPSYVDRVVVLRQGEVDEEVNVITAIDGTGLIATCFHDWDSPPALLDTYHVGYTIEDVATFSGCTFDTVKREWDFDRKLVIGQSPAAFALMGVVNGQRLFMSDEGATTEALEIINGAKLVSGTQKGLVTSPGGHFIFSHDGAGEVCMQVRNGATLCAFQTTFQSARTFEGVDLEISVIAGGILEFGDVNLIGITAPMKKRRKGLRGISGAGGVSMGTVRQLLDGAPSLNGWCTGDMDESILEAISGEPDDAKVYIVVEDVDT